MLPTATVPGTLKSTPGMSRHREGRWRSQRNLGSRSVRYIFREATILGEGAEARGKVSEDSLLVIAHHALRRALSAARCAENLQVGPGAASML